MLLVNDTKQTDRSSALFDNQSRLVLKILVISISHIQAAISLFPGSFDGLVCRRFGLKVTPRIFVSRCTECTPREVLGQAALYLLHGQKYPCFGPHTKKNTPLSSS